MEDPKENEQVETVDNPPAYTQSDIVALTSRIDELSALVKRDLLRQEGYEGQDIELALEYVIGTSEKEIRESIQALGDELPVLIRVAMKSKGRSGVDPGPNDGFRMEPRRINFDDIGADMFDRVKDKARRRGGGVPSVGALSPTEFKEKPKARRYR